MPVTNPPTPSMWQKLPRVEAIEGQRRSATSREVVYEMTTSLDVAQIGGSARICRARADTRREPNHPTRGFPADYAPVCWLESAVVA